MLSWHQNIDVCNNNYRRVANDIFDGSQKSQGVSNFQSARYHGNCFFSWFCRYCEICQVKSDSRGKWGGFTIILFKPRRAHISHPYKPKAPIPNKQNVEVIKYRDYLIVF